MWVRELMQSDLVSILPHVTVRDAHTLMRAHHFHHFPVIDEHGKLLGIISDRDILLALEKQRDTGWEEILVRDILVRRLITIHPDDSVEEAAARMVQRRISSLPVLDASGQMVGILTQVDVLRWVASGGAGRTASR